MAKALQFNSDTVGMWSSGLCLIHCAATPFLFVAKSCSAAASCCAASPTWWSWIDIGFLAISAIAIYFTARHTSKNWIRVALVAAWLVLAFIVGNEYWQMLSLEQYAIYMPAAALIGLHVYNQRFCECGDERCVTPAA